MSIKPLVRMPKETIATFLLITLASFVFISRTMDYTATSREMNRIADSYIGVIALDNGVPVAPSFHNGGSFSAMPATMLLVENAGFADRMLPAPPAPLSIEQMEAFYDIPGVNVYTRYMTAGIIRKYRAIDGSYSPFYYWGFDYTSRFVIEGTFVGEESDFESIDDQIIALPFTNIKVLAGSFRHLPKGGDSVNIMTFSNQGLVNNSYANSRDYNMLDNQGLGSGLADRLVHGKRYILLGRYPSDALFSVSLFSTDSEEQSNINSLWEWDGEARSFENTEQFDFLSDFLTKIGGLSSFFTLWLGDQDTKDYLFPVQAVDDLSPGSPESEGLQELIEIINLDPFTYDIVYTENMLSVPRFNEGSMVIREGRALMPEDTNAAVVSWYFYETHGLKLGDTLTIELGDRLFPQYSSLGATAYIPERRSNFIKTVEVEIVGVYLDVDSATERNSNQFWCYGPNTIFVPMGLMPVTVPSQHEVRPGEFSLVIENVYDIDAALARAEELASDMGLKLRFSDGGWAEVAEGISTSMQTTLVTMLFYVVGAMLALLLTVYIFIGRSKTNYAISRAMGMSKKDSGKSLIFPFALLSVTAVLVGEALGFYYASGLTSTSLSRLAELTLQYQHDESAVPIGVALICPLLMFAFMAISTGATLSSMSKRPILSLLQGRVREGPGAKSKQ